jgi:hypothetical protein
LPQGAEQHRGADQGAGLQACINSSSGWFSAWPTEARSMAWPPAMPREPLAREQGDHFELAAGVAERLAGQQLERPASAGCRQPAGGGFVELDVAGRRPRRSTSSSMHGRSSWTSE